MNTFTPNHKNVVTVVTTVVLPILRSLSSNRAGFCNRSKKSVAYIYRHAKNTPQKTINLSLISIRGTTLGSKSCYHRLKGVVNSLLRSALHLSLHYASFLYFKIIQKYRQRLKNGLGKHLLIQPRLGLRYTWEYLKQVTSYGQP